MRKPTVFKGIIFNIYFGLGEPDGGHANEVHATVIASNLEEAIAKVKAIHPKETVHSAFCDSGYSWGRPSPKEIIF
mgnify:CR=1 FL=1